MFAFLATRQALALAFAAGAGVAVVSHWDEIVSTCEAVVDNWEDIVKDVQTRIEKHKQKQRATAMGVMVGSNSNRRPTGQSSLFEQQMSAQFDIDDYYESNDSDATDKEVKSRSREATPTPMDHDSTDTEEAVYATSREYRSEAEPDTQSKHRKIFVKSVSDSETKPTASVPRRYRRLSRDAPASKKAQPDAPTQSALEASTSSANLEMPSSVDESLVLDIPIVSVPASEDDFHSDFSVIGSEVDWTDGQNSYMSELDDPASPDASDFETLGTL